MDDTYTHAEEAFSIEKKKKEEKVLCSSLLIILLQQGSSMYKREQMARLLSLDNHKLP